MSFSPAIIDENIQIVKRMGLEPSAIVELYKAMEDNMGGLQTHKVEQEEVFRLMNIVKVRIYANGEVNEIIVTPDMKVDVTVEKEKPSIGYGR